MKININSFEELIEFLQTGHLDDDQLIEVVHKALKVYVTKEPKDILLNRIVEYWQKWGRAKERPLFLEDTE